VIENTYGLLKRLDFVTGIVADLRPAKVLDVGCGTGSNLTALLARKFSDIEFVGVDSDEASIRFANAENTSTNARYVLEQDASRLGQFDLVIASEVIEHVEDPDAFLRFLRERLTPQGRLILTLPNGLGPFEFTSFVETLMHITGVYKVLRSLKHRLRGAPVAVPTNDTLAVSPHINFFSHRQIRAVISSNGLDVLRYQPRTLLCGFGFDQFMKSTSAIAWNARVADRLPPQMASAWMFHLKPGPAAQQPNYHRGIYARMRRYLNEKRWNLR
jgi:SAM-dependent methyltransferase